MLAGVCPVLLVQPAGRTELGGMGIMWPEAMTFTAKERQPRGGEVSDPSSRGWVVHKLPLWVAFQDAGRGHSRPGGWGQACCQRPQDMLLQRGLILEALWAESRGRGPCKVTSALRSVLLPLCLQCGLEPRWGFGGCQLSLQARIHVYLEAPFG